MDTIGLAVIQMRAYEDPKVSLRTLYEIASQMDRKEVDVVALPEAWMHRDPINHVPELIGLAREIVSALSSIAADLSAQVYGGGIYVMEGSPRIACPVIDRDGRILGWQYKSHLFSAERSIFIPGEELRLFPLLNWKVGVLICHDLVYPETARVLALRGADLIVCPSRIYANGVEPWHLYVKARCLENRVPIASPNVWLDDRPSGRSIIAEPSPSEDGVVLVKEHVLNASGCGFLLRRIDLDGFRQLREERLSARRPELYVDVCRREKFNYQL